MTQKFESGWENPDRHEPMTERPRPMFDEHGNAVDKAPPEPEELEFLRPGDPAARLSAAMVGRPDHAAVLTAEEATVNRMVELAGPALGPAVEAIGRTLLAELRATR